MFKTMQNCWLQRTRLVVIGSLGFIACIFWHEPKPAIAQQGSTNAPPNPLTAKEQLQSPQSIVKQGEQVEPLVAGGPAISRSLSGGEIHTYSVNLRTGQYFHLVLEQQRIDVIVKLMQAGGETITKVDRPNGLQGPEAVSL